MKKKKKKKENKEKKNQVSKKEEFPKSTQVLTGIYSKRQFYF
jgi:hypothetical protein